MMGVRVLTVWVTFEYLVNLLYMLLMFGKGGCRGYNWYGKNKRWMFLYLSVLLRVEEKATPAGSALTDQSGSGVCHKRKKARTGLSGGNTLKFII